MRHASTVSLTLALVLFGLDASADAVSPPTARFAAAPINYDLPSSGTDGGFFSTAMGTTNKHWALYDLTYDGKPDLIQTQDPKAGTVFGLDVKNAHWKTWRGTATGYDPNVAPMWTLPSSNTDGGFRDFGAGQTVRYWSVLNFEHRMQAALIQTLDPATAKVWKTEDGTMYWKLFRTDSNARFSAKEIRVIVGTSGKDKGFYSMASGWNTEQWVLLDMNGDGRLDLVQTMNPATGKVWREGAKKYWRVYYNNASNVGTDIRMDVPTQWVVPDAGSDVGFATSASNDGTKQWVTFDLDGDGTPEFVHTANPATGKAWGIESGNPHWRVYKRLPNAFGFSTTPILWPVPDSGTSEGFDAATNGGAGKNWVTLDLDGDGKPDLVQTSTTNGNNVWGAAASPYWKLFKNEGAGFSKTATSFPVPQSGSAGGFYSITNGTGNKHWTLVDIDGDKRLDLVQTADPATGEVWGTTSSAGASVTVNGRLMPVLTKKALWKVFRGTP